MGQKDTLLKRYFSDETRFADLINGIIGLGKELVTAEHIVDRDSQVGLRAPEEPKSEEVVPDERAAYLPHKKIRPRYRDVVRKVVLGVNFVVVGIESQELTHYLMPVRCMGYDLQEYERQAAEEGAQTLKDYEKKRIHLSKAEYLSAFRKNAKLRPCITMVLYFGDDWDGATSLHELLDYEGIPEEFHSFVNDYRIHILNVKKMESTEMFRSDLKLVFDSIRYSSDKEGFRKHVLENAGYRRLREDAYDVICEYTNLKNVEGISVHTYDKGGEGNMCKAVLDLMEESREEGREEGRDRLIRSMFQNGAEREFILTVAAITEEELEKILISVS